MSTHHAVTVTAGGPRERPRRTLFFLRREHDLPGAAPAVVALVSTCWTRFLRERAGLHGEPLFDRPAHEWEPDTHANGHPFAWIYRDIEHVLLDERRLGGAAAGETAADRMCYELEQALRAAIARAPGEHSAVAPADGAPEGPSA